jgi:hypothetical protein
MIDFKKMVGKRKEKSPCDRGVHETPISTYTGSAFRQKGECPKCGKLLWYSELRDHWFEEGRMG